MGGPIVRTGTTPEFWANWDNIFGEKKKKAGKKTPAKSAAKPNKSTKKATKKKSKTSKKK